LAAMVINLYLNVIQKQTMVCFKCDWRSLSNIIKPTTSHSAWL